MTDLYTLGSVAALEAFRGELKANRGQIENELESAYDVILDLLERVIASIAPEPLASRKAPG